MRLKTKRRIRACLLNVLYALIGLIMIYPLLWMFGAAFKTNDEIYNSFAIFPAKEWVTTTFRDGWKGVGTIGFTTFFINTFKIVIPCVVLTLFSSTLTAYGFARFNFPMKKPLFMCMLAMLMLPNAVIMIPTYILFKNLNWLNTYKPLIVPCLFAGNSFFIYLLVQFFRGIPREMDEAGIIDGCGSLKVFWYILLPLCTPALFSVGLFQFMWKWNDFYNSLIYINTPSKYPLSLGLRMSVDATSGVQWNKVMAMSCVSILPCIVLFFATQKYFIEGVSTGALKG